MTISEASIFFGVVVLILTTVVKTLKDGNNTDAMMKLFRGLSLETQKQAIKMTGHEEDITRLKISRDEHAAELKQMRKAMRDAGVDLNGVSDGA